MGRAAHRSADHHLLELGVHDEQDHVELRRRQPGAGETATSSGRVRTAPGERVRQGAAPRSSSAVPEPPPQPSSRSSGAPAPAVVASSQRTSSARDEVPGRPQHVGPQELARVVRGPHLGLGRRRRAQGERPEGVGGFLGLDRGQPADRLGRRPVRRQPQALGAQPLFPDPGGVDVHAPPCRRLGVDRPARTRSPARPAAATCARPWPASLRGAGATRRATTSSSSAGPSARARPRPRTRSPTSSAAPAAGTRSSTWTRCGCCSPAPPDDPFAHEVELANLRDLARNYRAAGAERLILAGVVEDAARGAALRRGARRRAGCCSAG